MRGGTGGHSHFITPPSLCPWHTRAAPKPELQLTRACLPAPLALLCAPGRSHSPAPCLADAAAAACSQPQLRGSSHTKPEVRQDRGTLPPRASQQRTRYGAASCWVRARSPFPEGLCWCCRGEERRQLLDAAERKKGEANLRVPPPAGRTQPAPQPGCAHSPQSCRTSGAALKPAPRSHVQHHSDRSKPRVLLTHEAGSPAGTSTLPRPPLLPRDRAPFPFPCSQLEPELLLRGPQERHRAQGCCTAASRPSRPHISSGQSTPHLTSRWDVREACGNIIVRISKEELVSRTHQTAAPCSTC